MTISTTVYVTHPDLGLVPTVRSLDEGDIGVVPNAGTDPEHNVYFFWVETPDFDAIEAALEADHTVSQYTMVSETPDRRTYRIAYSDQARLISPLITEMDGLMLDSRSRAEGWIVELRLPDHHALFRLGERVDDDDIQFDVLEIHQAEPDDESEVPLTEPQIEALVSAYEHGYYDEPRETSLEELGSMLGLSRTAVSGRLRRASSQLIEEHLESGDSDQ